VRKRVVLERLALKKSRFVASAAVGAVFGASFGTLDLPWWAYVIAFAVVPEITDWVLYGSFVLLRRLVRKR